MKRTITLFLIFALMATAVAVLAQPPAPPAGPMGGRAGARGDMCPDLMDRISKELSLTSDQVTQIQAIRKDFMDSTQATREQIKANMAQMKDLWLADTPDATAIKSLAAQTDTLRAQVRDSAIDHMIQGLAILTPDQKTKVRNWLEKNPHLMMGMGCGVCCGAGMHCPMMGGAPAGSAAGAAAGRGPGNTCCPCMIK